VDHGHAPWRAEFPTLISSSASIISAAMADPLVHAPAHPDFPFASTLDTISALLTAAGKTHLLKPRLGIVCGSGLSTLASHLHETFEIPYSSLAGFGQSHGELL
jgi:hypothetical protein